MNLYRGCTHNCIYCDGRSEDYYVGGEFGEDVTVKVNAIEILRRELDHTASSLVKKAEGHLAKFTPVLRREELKFVLNARISLVSILHGF